jgi:hypothetical protein
MKPVTMEVCTMKRSIALLLGASVASLVLLSGPSLQAQIVTNGSFEAVQIGPPYDSSDPTNIPGWTHTGSVGDALLWAVGYADGDGSITVAGDGRQFVTMGGGFGPFGTSHWDQMLTGLTPSATYDLSFKMAAEANYSGPQSITVDFPTGSSTLAQTFTAATPPFNYWSDWETKTMSFVAATSSVDLRFTAATVYDVGLDSVVVTPAISSVPEPGACALFASLGLSGVALLRRRRVR